MGSGLLLALTLCGVCLSGMLAPAAARVRRYPVCGEVTYFDDFMKCDASLEYCFEYDNSSCVGPPNWTCVDPLNRAAGLMDGTPDSRIRTEGYGNTRCCGGKYNSPINIDSYQSPTNCRDLPRPLYRGAHRVYGHVDNNGIYAAFKVEAEKYYYPAVLWGVPFTCAVPGSGSYVFTGAHVHIGGSEHRVDEKQYDGELHLVHVERDFWSSGQLDIRCASQSPLGITVIAVFLSSSEGEYNTEFNNLFSIAHLEQIQETEKRCPFDKICRRDDDDDDDNSNDNGDNNDSDNGDNNNNNDNGDNNKDSNSDSDSSDDDDNNNDNGDNNNNDSNSDSDSSDDDDFCDDLDSDDDDRDSNRYRRDNRRSSSNKHGNRDRNGDDSTDDDDNGNGRRRVLCFCRRRGFKESLLSPMGAKYGEQNSCSRNPGAADGNSHGKCSHYGNGGPCGDNAVTSYVLRPYHLLPKNREYYHYFGGLTSPPCSEVVNWMVMKHPIRITRRQLELIGKMQTTREDGRIKDYYNVRPTQSLNGRIVSNSIGCYW